MANNRVGVSKGHQTAQVVLNCLHIIELIKPIPIVGDEQYCRKCCAYRYVGLVNKTEWWTVCESSECVWARAYGQDRRNAERQADKHAYRKGHTVRVELRGVKAR